MDLKEVNRLLNNFGKNVVFEAKANAPREKVSGKLRDCDMKVYSYLVSKVGQKPAIYMTVKKMAVELNVNHVTIKRSLERLQNNQYICIKRTKNYSKTSIIKR